VERHLNKHLSVSQKDTELKKVLDVPESHPLRKGKNKYLVGERSLADILPMRLKSPEP
jgi:hypothetical protein